MNQPTEAGLLRVPPEVLADRHGDESARLRIAALVDAFHEDAARAIRHMAKAVDRSRAGLIPEAEQATLQPAARAILDRYAVVDALALHYRDPTRNALIRLLAIAFFSAFVVEVFATFIVEYCLHLHWPRLLFWLYPAAWVAAVSVWYWAHHYRYQRKYQDYRALGEGLRVQFFWNLLGISDAVEDHYLGKQQDELDWIRRALRAWRLQDEKVGSPAVSAEQRTALKALVRRHWVRAQYHYFAEVAGPRELRKGRRCKRTSAVFLSISVLLAVVICLWETVNFAHRPDAVETTTAHAGAPQHTGLHPFEDCLLFLVNMTLVAAAVAVAYGEKMAFAEHARQYKGTSTLFHNLDLRLSDGPLTEKEIQAFRDVGREALQENGDWLILHRDRPLEVAVP